MAKIPLKWVNGFFFNFFLVFKTYPNKLEYIGIKIWIKDFFDNWTKWSPLLNFGDFRKIKINAHLVLRDQRSSRKTILTQNIYVNSARGP